MALEYEDIGQPEASPKRAERTEHAATGRAVDQLCSECITNPRRFRDGLGEAPPSPPSGVASVACDFPGLDDRDIAVDLAGGLLGLQLGEREPARADRLEPADLR